MKKIGKTIVPRNPYAVAASQKKAGKHEATPKAERQHSKEQIREEIAAEGVNKNPPPTSRP